MGIFHRRDILFPLWNIHVVLEYLLCVAHRRGILNKCHLIFLEQKLLKMAQGKGAKGTTPKLPRNYEVAPGLSRFSKARLFHKRGLYQKLQKASPAKPKSKEDKSKQYVVKPIGGDKNGKERRILAKKGV